MLNQHWASPRMMACLDKCGMRAQQDRENRKLMAQEEIKEVVLPRERNEKLNNGYDYCLTHRAGMTDNQELLQLKSISGINWP